MMDNSRKKSYVEVVSKDLMKVTETWKMNKRMCRK